MRTSILLVSGRLLFFYRPPAYVVYEKVTISVISIRPWVVGGATLRFVQSLGPLPLPVASSFSVILSLNVMNSVEVSLNYDLITFVK